MAVGRATGMAAGLYPLPAAYPWRFGVPGPFPQAYR